MQNLILFTLLFAAGQVHAYPLLIAPRSEIQLPSTFSTDFDFEGIAELSNCSGSLVQLEGAKGTDYALILTNGHCLGSFIPAGEYVFGRATRRTFYLLKSDGREAGTVTSSEIVYATMTKTDLTIYKLTETYDQIKSELGVQPFLLSAQHSDLGQSIDVISGFWKRGYRCQVEAFVHQLKEGEWTCEDSIRYSRPGCEVIGGTSGSPIIADGTRTVVGINNTGNEDGARCTDNNPCEIDENGNVTYVQGYSYGQEILWIYSCLNSDREIDLTIPNCALPH